MPDLALGRQNVKLVIFLGMPQNECALAASNASYNINRAHEINCFHKRSNNL